MLAWAARAMACGASNASKPHRLVDLPRSFTPGTSAAFDEMELTQVLTSISHRRYNAVGIVATNPFDVVFLRERFAASAPTCGCSRSRPICCWRDHMRRSTCAGCSSPRPTRYTRPTSGSVPPSVKDLACSSATLLRRDCTTRRWPISGRCPKALLPTVPGSWSMDFPTALHPEQISGPPSG